MDSQVLRVAWYRVLATARRRLAGYLGLVLVIGLTGGVALGSAAAARRTQASFPVFLASTNPSDLTVQYATSGYPGLPPFAGAVRRVPGVRRAESAFEPVADVLGSSGAPTAASIASGLGVAFVASVDGLYFDQDRVAVVRGFRADPRRPDQVMMNAQAASSLGLRVGERLPVGFYTDAQASSPAYGTPRQRPAVRIEATITGLVEFSDGLVQDDIDRPQGELLLTPAIARTLLTAGASSGISWYGLQLAGGAASVPAAERSIDRHLGNGGQAWFKVTSADAAQVQSAIEPDWIALAAFAIIAVLAALLVGAQAVARQIRAGAGDRPVLRALGASPAMVTADGLLGTLADGQGPAAIPRQQVDSALRAAPGVAAWATISFSTANVNGQAVPVLFGTSGATVAPPLLSGHGVAGSDQIVLGAATLTQLRQHVGGTVTFALAAPGRTIRARLTIVGTATMPTVGLSDVLHTSMGTGALASSQLLGAAAASCAGAPGLTLVRLRPGVTAAAGLVALRRVTAGVGRQLAAVPAANPCHGDTLGVLSVQHPAQIANYATIGVAPALLAVFLAAGAAAALFLTLFASVRRRRRDLAVLKTIGFTRRQLTATVAWQATVAAIVGCALGIPLGIALGRWLWTSFARQIYAVPEPTVPAGWMILLPVCTLVLVNLVAALPGWTAARTPAALALRAE